jgi:hypothetical protein
MHGGENQGNLHWFGRRSDHVTEFIAYWFPTARTSETRILPVYYMYSFHVIGVQGAEGCRGKSGLQTLFFGWGKKKKQYKTYIF